MRLSEFRAITGSGPSTCIICGEVTEDGGQWLGHGGRELIICYRQECVRSLIHTAYDAMMDLPGCPSLMTKKDWREMTDEPHTLNSPVRNPDFYGIRPLGLV